MTNLQKLQLRASEIRKRLAEIAGTETDKMTDEIRSELTELRNEYTDIETRSQAAMIAEDAPIETRSDPQATELGELQDKASLGNIFDCTLEHRSTDGAEAELQQHHGLASNMVPIDLLETRAVTPAPGNVAQNQAAIIKGVFPQSAAAFLGISMPTVGVGESIFPVLTKNATVHTPAENAAAAETTGSFSADVLTPKRLQASFFYSRESKAKFSGLDEALRQNLSDALSDSLDKQILAGDPTGLLHGTVLDNNNVSAITTFNGYRTNLSFGRVDGTYANSVADIRVLMGSGTYAHASGVYRSDNADYSALDALMRVISIRVSAHIPAVASNKQNALVARGNLMHAVAPIWSGIQLVPDEITRLAAHGEIVLTAIMLYNFKLLRADGFHKQETRHV